MYNRSIILRATSYIDNRQTIFNQLNIMVPYVRRYNWSMPYYCNFMRNLCDAA